MVLRANICIAINPYAAHAAVIFSQSKHEFIMARAKSPSSEGGTPRATFIPSNWEGMSMFVGNINKKLPGYKVVLAITDAELARIAAIDTVLTVVNADIENVLSAKEARVKFRKDFFDGPSTDPAVYPGPVTPTDPLPKDMFFGNRRWISEFCFSLKGRAGYNDNIGKDLQITSEKPSNAVDEWQPVLNVKFVGGVVKIAWRKGVSDGVVIFVDRTGDGVFVRYNNATGSSIEDTTPLPQGVNLAEWTYQAMYLLNNKPVGLMSSPVKITITR